MRVCHICKGLIFDAKIIEHFRNGDEKHKAEYIRIQRYLIVSDGVTDRNVLSYLIDKHLVDKKNPNDDSSQEEVR